ncbi:hypothetical protein DFH06DRAFT_1086494 [Mycena polygramma]|nr:hypothetical protein DFH06DRAFT_1086494 [Mycena polygramma]
MIPSGGRAWLTITLICCHLLFLSSYVQAHIHQPSARHHAIGKRDALSDSGLSTASWIWTAKPTTGNVAFLRTFASTGKKTATSATISITAVNHFTVFVNGQPIGANGDGTDDWKSVQVLSAGLNSTSNTFAVLAVNNANSGAPPPGLLAAIKITYADSSSETVVSDASWTVSATIPTTFPTVSAASDFVSATVLAAFGSGSWGSSLSVLPANADAALLSASTWIWSTQAAATKAATGTVGFRKTVDTPAGKTAQSATVRLAVDNGFTLYVNGHYVGTSPGVPVVPDFKQAQQFTGIDLTAASNVFTVFASNIAAAGSTDGGPAGLAAAISILYSDGSTSVTTTDATWLSGDFTTVPAFVALADTALTPAFALAKMGAAPWGAITAISNALAAANVPAGPFAAGTVPQTTASNTNPASSAASVSPTSAGHVSTGAGASSAASTAAPQAGSSPSGADASSPSSSSNPASDAASNPSGSSSTHSTTVIIAAIAGVIAVIAVGLALFFWRRRARDTRRHARTQSTQLFDSANLNHPTGASPMSGPQPAQMSHSRRTSMTSVGTSVGTGMGRPEIVTVQPQHAPYAYPRPPVMAQAAYAQHPAAGYQQPPVMTQAMYAQPSAAPQTMYAQSPVAPYSHQPTMAQGMYMQPPAVGYPQPPAMMQGGYVPPLPTSAVGGYPQTQGNWVVEGGPSQPVIPAASASKLEREQMWQNNAGSSSQPEAQPAAAASAPLSKLERERLWRSNASASASGTSSARTSVVELGYARESVVVPSSPQEGHSDEPAPPSYSVQ